MAHEATSFITTVAIAFVAAFMLGFLAQKLRLSPIVGYLLAGVAVGPHTPGFEIDADLANQFAELGIILLMFGVGLHFSIKDLREVRGVAVFGALIKTVVATAIGFYLARWWGWSAGASVIFGLCLSVASTVVLTRALEARHALDAQEGRIAVGWLIVEDLIMVIALVLLPTMTDFLRAGDLPAARLVGLSETITLTVGKIAFFGAIVVLVGRKVAPWLLAQVARTGSRELFTLSVLALAFGIAYGSSELFGVSFALGAFFAGMVLNESDLSYQAAADSIPFQDAFAVLFFVSVGMLFDPAFVLGEPLHVVSAVAVVILAKAVISFVIVLAFRYPVRVALTVAAGLGQIGEFSFILAALGVQTGALTTGAQSLILSTALISISLNPFLMQIIGPLDRALARWNWFSRAMERYCAIPGAAPEAMTGHTILVGYGRVGSVVGAELVRQGQGFVVIEHDRTSADKLRAAGFNVIFGNGGAQAVLEAAHVGAAKLMVVTVPDGFVAGHILTQARKINPSLKVIARSHSAEQLKFLKRQGADLAVMGEHELAVVMAEYSLRLLGIAEHVIDEVLHDLRRSESFSPLARD
jgi:monovalent cation:H+ antiporter-2, CPA2 family